MRIAVLSLAALPLLGQVVRLNDDGGWCWFQDPRALIDGGKLFVGSVAAGTRDAARRGNIELTTYDLATGQTSISVLHQGLLAGREHNIYDDHTAPALLVRPDGRLLAVYTKHHAENRFYYRISSAPHDGSSWQPERTYVPSESSKITYSNLHWLSRERRVYDFFRGLNDSFKPSYTYSEDEGASWKTGSVFIEVPTQFKHRPYVKYASNGIDTVHMVYTDGHPRNFLNSVYHVYYQGGKLYRSNGSGIRSLAEGLKEPAEGTVIFKGGENNVGWVDDLRLDANGRPYVAFSVRKDAAGLDLRYHYARWNGSQWVEHEIAHAGTRLYKGEDDYPGLMTLDPDDLATVYISANADPVSGRPVAHYQIFRGHTTDGGVTWRWTAVTDDSAVDNLRPILPKWDRGHRALLWLRGTLKAYTNYDLAVVGLIGTR